MTLTPGDRRRVTILDIAFGGEGVARVEDFVLFVPFVLVEEEVEVEVVEVKKRFARARLLQVLRRSPERVAPECPYFGNCGGCQYQHVSYPTQLRIKYKQIADLFQRLGGLAGTRIDPVVACPRPYGYRNRIMIRSQWDKFKQGLNIGYIRYDNRLVVDIDHCPIAEPELNRQIQDVRAHPPPKGGLKVVLRLPPPGWEVPPDSFFQNNFHLLLALVEGARARLQDSGARHLVDVYCGVGFFGLELAGQVQSFIGIELDQRAIRAAQHNAMKRNCANGRFLAGLAEDLLPDVLAALPVENTAVILDPPRTGCPHDLLELLRRLRLAQILYVSCHPATLARDLGVLTSEDVYRVVRVTPFDMFPQTQHVECIADLRLGKAA